MSDQPNFPHTDTSEYDDFDLEEFHKSRMELSKLKFTAIKTAMKDKMTQYYKKLIDEEQYEHFPGYAEEGLTQLHKLKVKADNITDIKQGNNTHCFFTINFKPDSQDIENVEEVMQDFTKKCSFVKDDFVYAIEQRSEEMETAGQGTHVHILFEKGNNAPSKIERAFKGKFFDKHVANVAALDYRYITQDKVKEKLEYICGVKKKDKMPKVYIDRQFREEKKVKDIYPHSNYFTLISETLEKHKLKLRY